MAKKKISPGMQQYLDIENYPDAFLLFRMGDFYELFYEDTVKAAQDLEINLTSRNKNADNPIPMTGVLIIQLKPILMSWLRWSYKVAIAEQMEDLNRLLVWLSVRLFRLSPQGQWLTVLNLIMPTISW